MTPAALADNIHLTQKSHNHFGRDATYKEGTDAEERGIRPGGSVMRKMRTAPSGRRVFGRQSSLPEWRHGERPCAPI